MPTAPSAAETTLYELASGNPAEAQVYATLALVEVVGRVVDALDRLRPRDRG